MTEICRSYFGSILINLKSTRYALTCSLGRAGETPNWSYPSSHHYLGNPVQLNVYSNEWLGIRRIFEQQKTWIQHSSWVHTLGILWPATRSQGIANKVLQSGGKSADATNESKPGGWNDLRTFSQVELIHDSIRNSFWLQTKVPWLIFSGDMVHERSTS